jgi:hypothetical protein
MKIKKTVTAKVIAANRANGQKATGPRNSTAVTQNARTHGLLSKYILFQGEEEKKEFDTLLDELEEEQQAAGRMERALVEEAAVCLWKLQSANDLEIQELSNRREASKAIMKSLAESDEEKLPLFSQWDGSPSPAQLGWECRELTLRRGTSDSEQEKEISGGRNSEAAHVQIEAKMTTSLDTTLRYQAGIKRDLYRAVAALRDIRRERNGEG